MVTNPHHVVLNRVRRAADKAAAASAERDEAIRKAHAHGASLRAIAFDAGLSFQRVHQIVTRDEARQVADTLFRRAFGREP